MLMMGLGNGGVDKGVAVVMVMGLVVMGVGRDGSFWDVRGDVHRG